MNKEKLNERLKNYRIMTWKKIKIGFKKLK